MSGYREAFPIVHVDDVERTAALYRDTFGFAETFRHERDGRADFAFLQLEPLGIGVGRKAEGDERGFALWIYADAPAGVDEAAAALRAAGATEVLAPTDQPWGERMCSYVDPDGTLVHVGAKL